MGKVIERMTGESYDKFILKNRGEEERREGRKEEEKGGREGVRRRKFHVILAIIFPILET